MIQYALKIMSKGSQALYALVSGIAGAMLYPLLRLLRLYAAASFMLGVFIGVSGILSYQVFGYVYDGTLLGLLSALSLSLVAAVSAFVSLSLIVLPLLGIRSALRILLLSPIEGFKIGWDDGLSGILESLVSLIDLDDAVKDFTGFEGWGVDQVFKKLLSTFNLSDSNDHGASTREAEVNELRSENERLQFLLLLARRIAPTAEGDEHEDFLAELFAQAQSPLQDHMTEAQFQQVQLQEPQLILLRNGWQAPLLQDEIGRLEQMPGLRNELQRYNNLLRLNVDQCFILLDRPEPQDTVLLVKQYRALDGWLPVPGVVSVHDRASLHDYLMTNNVHPTNRDSIVSPPAYYQGDDAFLTRYVIHPYHIGPNGVGVSEEMNILTARLRASLTATPSAQNDDVVNTNAAYASGFFGRFF